MRQAMRSSGSPTSFGRAVPAPVGGWNARDPIANMPAIDAVILDNFFPDTTDVRLRRGSEEFANIPVDDFDLTPHDIRALMPYNPPSGTFELFAAAQDGIYDVTAGGEQLTPASVCTDGAFQYVNITTAGGSFLWCCNGVDDARYYNGTTWTVLNTLSTPALTGIVSADIVNVSLHKARMYLTCKDSLSFWYLAPNSIAGAASEFPLGALFRKGGYLMATASWTLDGGNGPEDYFVAVTSEGEVAIYAGTDPANAATWSLQGVYFIGAPIGRRCLINIGGDLGLLTVRGLFPISQALQKAAVDSSSAISDKIVKAWETFAERGKDFFGWQPIVFPEASMLIVNVPAFEDASINLKYSYQFVMNTDTKAWCRFTNLSAECMAVVQGRWFYALHNKVFEGHVGQIDRNTPIDGRAKTAFFYPAGRGNLAHLKLIRPVLESSTLGLKYQLAVDTDYAEGDPAFSDVSTQQGTAVWDVALWDQALWSGDQTILQWRTVAHSPGKAVSVRLRVLGRDITMIWNATDMILQRGGLLG